MNGVLEISYVCLVLTTEIKLEKVEREKNLLSCTSGCRRKLFCVPLRIYLIIFRTSPQLIALFGHWVAEEARNGVGTVIEARQESEIM